MNSNFINQFLVAINTEAADWKMFYEVEKNTSIKKHNV